MSKFLKAAAVAVFSSVFVTSVFAADDVANTATTADQQPAVEKSAEAPAPRAHHAKKHHHKKAVKKSPSSAEQAQNSADQAQESANQAQESANQVSAANQTQDANETAPAQ